MPQASPSRSLLRRFVPATRRSRQIMAGAVATAAGMMLVLGLLLAQERQYALDFARSTSTNLVTLVERELARNVEFYALSLQAIVDEMARTDLRTLSRGARERALLERAIMGRHVSSAFVVDGGGRILAAMSAHGALNIEVTDRDYFQVHRDRSDVGLYLSKPYLSRLNGEYNIAFSRRVNGPRGDFAGVAVIAISLSYLRDLLGSLELGEGDTIALVQRDGNLLMRLPSDPRAENRNMASAPQFGRLLTANEGSFDAYSSIDGRSRQYVFRGVQGLPLIAVVAQSHDGILRAWKMRAASLGALMTLLAGALLWLAGRAAAELDGRLRAEEELRRLATHDTLTGLYNRRGLDRLIADGWTHAVTGGRALTLLFVDVDHFKRFNDTHGHARGDLVLAQLGEVLRACAVDAGGAAGRYGGEEFVVVLPGELDDARETASRIRAALSSQRIAHAGGIGGLVTVSIGIASSSQFGLDGAGALVEAADQALYVAKALGRDRAVIYVPSAARVAG